MKWISEVSTNSATPVTGCAIHGCWSNKDDGDYCGIRICATRWCLIDY